MLKRLARCLIAFSFAGAALAQPPSRPDPPENHRPPLFFREAWNHSGTPAHPITQQSVSNPNLELKLYGERPRPDPEFGGIWENKRAQPLDDPAHTFTGTCTRPCGLTFRDRNSYVDMTGFAKIVWRVKTEGFHVLRRFDLRWRRLDPEKVVTMTGAQAGWVINPDLSKVDEIGFVDLMPGSGHGNGGWSDLAWMEVYGRAVPRPANSSTQ